MQLLSAMKTIAGFVLGVVMLCGAARASVYTINFSGTYSIDGSQVPYSFEITYDTSLGALLYQVPADSSLGAYTTTHPWFGYSAAGVTATDLSFQGLTWTAADLSDRIPVVGVAAALWFDTALGAGNPTKAWLYLSNSDGDLQLGGASGSFNQIFLRATSSIMSNGFPQIDASSSNLTMSVSGAAVPEPSTTALLGGLAVLGFVLVRRRVAQG